MEIKLKRDATAAVVIAGFGTFTTLYSYLHYPTGTVTRMGAGMFPIVLGSVLILMGILIFVKAMLVEGQYFSIDLREAAFVLSSLALFGVLVGGFGIVPAIVALVVVSSAAARPFSLVRSLMLAAVITLGIVLIFIVAMDLNISMFGWPL